MDEKNKEILNALLKQREAINLMADELCEGLKTEYPDIPEDVINALCKLEAKLLYRRLTND